MSTSDDRTRQLLVYLAAALIAGGASSHEVEASIRAIGTRLGHPGVQLHAQPVGVTLSLGFGSPSTYESVEGPLRLDQSAAVADIQQGLLAGAMHADDALDHPDVVGMQRAVEADRPDLDARAQSLINN